MCEKTDKFKKVEDTQPNYCGIIVEPSQNHSKSSGNIVIYLN